MNRRIPVLCQFIIEANKSNGTACHLERSNVVTYQRACNVDLFAMQDAMQGIVYHIKFDQRSAAHAIDHCKNRFTRFEAEVLDDRSGEHLSYLECRCKFNTLPSWLTMNTDT